MNLINELQVSAEADDVLTVLRKTKRLASKLSRSDISAWLDSEQSGYKGDPVPEYRIIKTIPAYKTEGFVPAGYGRLMKGIQDISDSGLDLPVTLYDPICDIMSMIDSIDKRNGIYRTIGRNTEFEQKLRHYVGVNSEFDDQISLLLHLNEAQIKSIPERIKDRVLEWACALESAGVTGEGLTFSAQDRAAAQTVTFHISQSHIEQLTNSGTNLRR